MDKKAIIDRTKRAFEDTFPYQEKLLPDSYDGWSFSDEELDKLILFVIDAVKEAINDLL
jgi:hypothetical protein